MKDWIKKGLNNNIIKKYLMVDTLDLSFEEEKWLEIFSKNKKFFRSLKSFYKKNDCLTADQYYYLEKEIDKAEDNRYVVLSKKEARVLSELVFPDK